MKTVKDVMDEYMSHLKIDKKLAKTTSKWLDSFVTKNDAHLNFFGGHSFGRHKPVLTTLDRAEWIMDVCEIADEDEIRDAIKGLPSMNPNWIKYSDVFNMSCAYLIYCFYNSNLSPSAKHQAMVDYGMILNIRFLTSFMAISLLHETPEEIEDKMYENLSYKYSLKKAGTWYNLLRKRSEDMVAPSSIHIGVVKSFRPDESVFYFISDTQTRIKNLIKQLFEQMLQAKEDELRRLKSTSMVEMEDGLTVRDMKGQYQTYKTYIENTLLDRNDFIRAEIIEAVLGIMNNTVPPPIFGEVIIRYYESYNKRDNLCHEILEDTLLHVFDKIQRDKEIQKKTNNIADLLLYVKSLYTAARSGDEVINLRKKGETFIKKKVKVKSENLLGNTRTALLLYLVARTFLMKKY